MMYLHVHSSHLWLRCVCLQTAQRKIREIVQQVKQQERKHQQMVPTSSQPSKWSADASKQQIMNVAHARTNRNQQKKEWIKEIDKGRVRLSEKHRETEADEEDQQ